MRCLDMFDIANMNVHYFRYPFSYFLERQAELGMGSVVLWGSVPHIWVDQYGYEDIDGLYAALCKHDIKLSAYAARPYNYSLFAPEGSQQRQCTQSYYKFCIDIALRLKTNRICIDLWGALRDRDADGQYERCIEMLSGLCAYANERGCTVIVGNAAYKSSALINTLGDVQRLKKDINMNNCGIALDVCTALENGEDIKYWLDSFGKDLCMVYLADGRNNGAGYPLGYGCYPVAKILQLLKERGYSGTVALKMDREMNELNPARTDRINASYITRCISEHGV